MGVDPGTNMLGYAVIKVNNNKLGVVELGVVQLHKYERYDEKLKNIFEKLQRIIKTHNPKEMAIEAPFYGKNVQSMLKLGRAQGVAIAAAATLGLQVAEYAPKKIKQSVTGNGNASKEQVAAMLTTIFKKSLGDYPLDATDALGAAACHYFQGGSSVSSPKRYSSWESFVKENPSRKK